ncbi:MAG: putative 4-hydroxybenzoate polyprenyltransferase [Bacteroidales bacterium]|nr:putative 4-hydroxybenzoate polyprenyltransferase [Bacteroidales bacterium]
MIKNYLSLVKFSHTIFAMPFAIIGFFLAVKTTETNLFSNEGIKILILVLLDMVFARNAAMGFNRWLDRKIDAKNPRTVIREIPSGKIKAEYALWFVIINSVLFLIATFFINMFVFMLAPVALIVVLGYSYTKRFTALSHFVLGLGLSLAPVGSYLAVTGEFSLLPVLFSLTVLFWTAGFDIIYSLQDEEFDKKEKLKSIPAFIGKKNALNLSILLHLITAGFIIWAGIIGADFLGIWYWAGAFFFGSSLFYQHIIVKTNDLSKVNLSFFTVNGIASVIFAVFTIVSLYIG